MRILFSLIPVMLVIGYYGFEWYKANLHFSSLLVVKYEPPRNLSPAMLRYVWKERFDDRTFWACVLSLVSKGLVVLENEEGKAYGNRSDAQSPRNLPPEESLLLQSLFPHRKKTDLHMDDPVAALAAWELAQKLRSMAVGRWFHQNRKVVTVGTIFSILSVVIAAVPQSLDDWGALLFGVAVMIPAGYYFFFVLLRVADMLRALRGDLTTAFASRLAFLVFIGLCCIGSFVLGALVVTESFSWLATAIIAILAVINTGALLWLRLPTVEGRRVLDEIEGFREYLQTVEKLPMDNPQAPTTKPGLYEEYLPYALALDVEQKWVDKQLAATSCFQEELQQGVRPFYLGTWDGKPIEVVYKPPPNSRGW